MNKRIICAFLALVITLLAINPAVYAASFSDAYNAGVSSAMLSKSSKERIERELLRVLRLEASAADMAKIQGFVLITGESAFLHRVCSFLI